MALTYYLSTRDPALTGGADFSYRLYLSAEGSATTTFAVTNASSDVSYAWTPAGFPGTGGISTGAFSVKVPIGATGNALVTVRPRLTRVNSAGTAQAGPIDPAEAAQTCTANTTFTFTWTNPTLGTWATGDRLRVEYVFTSSVSMGTPAQVSVITGTTASEVVTPFSDVITAAGTVIGTETFTAAAGTNLETHNASFGNIHGANRAQINAAGRLRNVTTGSDDDAGYRYATAPVSAEYDVRADIFNNTTSVAVGSGVGVAARVSADQGASADFYLTYWYHDNCSLRRIDNGSSTTIATVTTSSLIGVGVGTTKAHTLRCRDAFKQIIFDGQLVISSTDNTISAAGKAGLYSWDSTEDRQIDNWVAQDTQTAGVAGTRYRSLMMVG
jgi:hypothetical protein